MADATRREVLAALVGATLPRGPGAIGLISASRGGITPRMANSQLDSFKVRTQLQVGGVPWDIF